MINKYFKSIIDQTEEPVVICDLDFKILYMNNIAITNYNKNLVGKNLRDCHNADSNKKMEQIIDWFRKDTKNNKVYTYHSNKSNCDTYIVALRDENQELIGFYERHISRNVDTNERYVMG